MRAIKAALLWTLGVAAMLLGLAPGGAPVSAAAAPRQAAPVGGSLTQPSATPGSACALVTTASTVFSGRAEDPTSPGDCLLRPDDALDAAGDDRRLAADAGTPAALVGTPDGRAPPMPSGA